VPKCLGSVGAAAVIIIIIVFIAVMTVIRNYKCGGLISELSRDESFFFFFFFLGASGTSFFWVGC